MLERYLGRKSLVNRFEKNFILIASVIVGIFALERITQYCYLENRCILGFSPYYILFFLAVPVMIWLLRRSRNMDGKKSIIMLVAAILVFQASVYINLPNSIGNWSDEVGYYNTALISHAEGPIFLVSHWSDFVTWKPELREKVEERFGFLGIENWIPDKPFSYDGFDYVDDLRERPAKSTPFWSLIISPFLFVDIPIIANFVAWAFTFLGIVAFYFFVKRFSDRRFAINLTLIFMLIPMFIIYSATPLVESPMVFFVIVTFHSLFIFLEEGKEIYLLVSSLLFSFTFLLKPTFGILAIPIFYLLIFHNPGKRRRLLDIATYIGVASLIPVLLTLIDYSIVFNMITSYGEHMLFFGRLGVGNPIIFILKHLPNDLVRFGIPVVMLFVLGVLKFDRKGFIDRLNLVNSFTVILISLSIVFPLDRYLIPALPLLAFLALKNKELVNERVEVLIVFMVIEVFLFMILPARQALWF